MRNNLIIFGDLHFNTNREWDREAFGKFIEWFEKYQWNKDDELLQLGDVVEKASNLGDTLELVTKFFDIACNKFKKIYILGGNHCHKLVNERSQYATQYLPFLNKNKVKLIYKEEAITTENGYKVLCLPYRRIYGKILDDYYTNELDSSFYTSKYDLICGHVAIKEPKTFYGGIDITKFQKTNFAFGHIHSRNGTFKQHYTGSIMPFKIDEEKTELPRCYKILSDTGIKDISLPEFIIYENLKLGDTPLYKKNSDNKVHIYTVTNCKNINQAKSLYPDYYIRGVEKIVNNTTVNVESKETIFMTPIAALDQLIKETKLHIKRKTLSLLKTILS